MANNNRQLRQLGLVERMRQSSPYLLASVKRPALNRSFVTTRATSKKCGGAKQSPRLAVVGQRSREGDDVRRPGTAHSRLFTTQSYLCLLSPALPLQDSTASGGKRFGDLAEGDGDSDAEHDAGSGVERITLTQVWTVQQQRARTIVPRLPMWKRGTGSYRGC